MNKWTETNLGILRLSFKDFFVYRWDFLVWTIAQPLMLVIFYFLWTSVYAHSGTGIIQGFTLQQMINYYVIIMVLRFIISTNIDRWTADKILNGTLTKDLAKPITYYRFWLVRTIGGSLFLTLTMGIPMLVMGMIFFGLNISSLVNLLLFLVSALLAIILNFTLILDFGLSAFWLQRYGGLSSVRYAIFGLLNGSVIPLVLFPQALQKVLTFLPMQYTMYSPARIFLGNYTVMQSLFVILMQFIWIAILFIFHRLVWERGIRRFAGVGS